MINPSKIMQVGMGFWASKTLLSAINMGLFTLLAEQELDARAIQNALGLHDRGLYDFLDALVALGFLKRSGLLESAIYSNADDTDFFLDKNKPDYMGDILEMSNNRSYLFWANLEEALRTGQAQNETKDSGESLFDKLYADEALLSEFIAAMGGIQLGNFKLFSQRFDFSPFKTFCDVGGAGAQLSIEIANANEHMHCISYDLPAISNIANANITTAEIENRVSTLSGDFFKDQLPKADIITMGNILHDWGLEQKKQLIQKAYDALPDGGVFIAIENIIDSDRRENAFGLLMSLNMLIETDQGFDYSASDFNAWTLAAGFKRTRIMLLNGPTSAAIAYK